MKLECGKVYRTKNNAKVFVCVLLSTGGYAALVVRPDIVPIAMAYLEDGTSFWSSDYDIVAELEPSSGEFKADEQVEVSNNNVDWHKRIFVALTPHEFKFMAYESTLPCLPQCWRYCRKLQPDKKWRVPTDEDATKRPPCRVRDHSSQQWSDEVLVAVINSLGTKFISRDGRMWLLCEIEDKS